MNKFIYGSLVVISVMLLGGCSSNNVKRFSVDNHHINKAKMEKSITKKIAIKDVVMANGDKNAIMCRMVGNIYLPNKMTYSQYIKDAFNKTLLSMNRLSEDSNSASSLMINLNKVEFSSTSGKWYIDAGVKVGNHAAIDVSSITEFGTSFVGEFACRNVAEAFDEAVGNFVDKVLSNPKIINNL